LFPYYPPTPLQVGPVTGNTFINNVVEGNTGFGITAGALGHNINKTSEYNVFAGNIAADNNVASGGSGENAVYGQYDVHHGATKGDYWTGNVGKGDGPTFAYMQVNATAVFVFDP
jgi:hypothetical protein